MARRPGLHWKVRPYMTARGRTGSRSPLLIHTLVSTGNRYDPLLAASLAPASRTLYEQARRMCSVAELSASCGLPLGLTRVLISDLLKIGQLVVHEARPSQDLALLERLRAGLVRLT
ncbi:DUF742 domain-containing protein [Actinoplanes derwentensis]|uniref:DUF742 domain-containing protein n=1 Tax=Actinoplanes derwentensis TaxID=113562 RepID=A0A1H2CX86_9ACTN|nr:DUF742 domain-containing protein [Actinoplanes derwentensis]GID87856.1 hypothetical protein Ade03nite_67800 [Actinoplanes derwentensis]SDT74822.1 Protein of unknown function [Actinoplanes derwentensis]